VVLLLHTSRLPRRPVEGAAPRAGCRRTARSRSSPRRGRSQQRI